MTAWDMFTNYRERFTVLTRLFHPAEYCNQAFSLDSHTRKWCPGRTDVSGGQRNNLMRSVTREVDGTTDKSQMLLEPTVERVSCFRSPTRRRGRGAETFIWHVV